MPSSGTWSAATWSHLFILFPLNFKLFNVKGKAVPVTGREGPQGCETSRLPNFLNNRLTDGGEVVSPTRRPPFILQEDSW
jgi:hypothetical protein